MKPAHHQVYECLDKIGEGTYSCVFSGRDRRTGRRVALKNINLTTEDGAPSTALREIAFMKQMSAHPHIVRLLDVVHPQEDSLTLVFEHLSLDLRQFLDQHHPRGMPLPLVKSFMRQMLAGLATCHHNYIIHRDLKPQNILIDLDTGIVKLGDFGLARGYAIPVAAYSPEVVTLWYRPPEVLLGNTDYSCPVDLWSAGCILVEMLTGKAPFQGRSVEDQLRAVMRALGPFTPSEWEQLRPDVHTRHPRAGGMILAAEQFNRIYTQRVPLERVLAGENIPPLAIDLLRRLLAYAPYSRCTADEALRHPFLAS